MSVSRGMYLKICGLYLTHAHPICIELHDSLGAWGGLGASIGAIWKELRFMRHVCFDVIAISIFFCAVSVLHIAVPVVVTVGAVTRNVNISVDATTMPGRIFDLGIGGAVQNSVDQLSNSLTSAISSLPYLYQQRNDSTNGLPNGFNDS